MNAWNKYYLEMKGGPDDCVLVPIFFLIQKCEWPGILFETVSEVGAFLVVCVLGEACILWEGVALAVESVVMLGDKYYQQVVSVAIHSALWHNYKFENIHNPHPSLIIH